MSEILVLSTADSMELADKIATALIEERHAACVNILPGVHSIYRWEGKICRDAEWLLLIKSTADKFEAVRSTICRVHAYQIPEVIAVPIVAGDPRYLEWLKKNSV